MDAKQATARVMSEVIVTREDVARAKAFVLASGFTNTDELADHWLREHRQEIPRSIDGNASTLAESLTHFARSISLRLSLSQAIWELIAAVELIPTPTFSSWRPSVNYRHQGIGSGLSPNVDCADPSRIQRPPLASTPTTDVDLFLQGVNCKGIHPGILEAVEQALTCFRRGLYLPATVMLAAAVEATWIECGSAVAKKLPSKKLENLVSDSFASISKKVMETRKVLENAAANQLLKDAHRRVADVTDAEVWTTTLRDRRNALHWDKDNRFIADHAVTGTLLMAAPMHLATLEAIRIAC